jgi:predicted Rossmann fold nucleotide-binding protein DprA/Smf involved in DNA uptake
LASAGIAADQALSALSALELAGYVRREAGGRYVAVP